MLKNLENRARVDALIEEINKLYSDFSELHEELKKLESHRGTLLKAAEADKEAIEIRIQMSDPARNLEYLRRALEKTFVRLALVEALDNDSVKQALQLTRQAAFMKYQRNDFDTTFNTRYALMNEKEIIAEFFAASILKALPSEIEADYPDYIRDALRKDTRGFQPFSLAQIAMRRRGHPAVDRALQQNPERKAYPL